jgi:hypothetical protein
MKVLTTTALVALLAGSIGIAGLIPSYAAQAADAQTQTAMGRHHFGPHRPGMRGDRMSGFGMPLMMLGCSDRGGEAIEIAFVHVKYELKLTATQQPLLDALETAALADQKSFAATCKTTLGDKDAAMSGTLLDRLQGGLTLSQAKVTALEDIVPKLKAFYDSLSADQQAQLNAHRGGRGKGRWMGKPGGPGMMGPMAPDATPPDGTMQPNSTVPSSPAATPPSAT